MYKLLNFIRNKFRLKYLYEQSQPQSSADEKSMLNRWARYKYGACRNMGSMYTFT